MTLDEQQKIKRQDKLIRLDELKPYEFNNRNHPAEQVEMIARSLKEFGWTNPILVDENMSIIAGHGRFLSAVKLGMTEAPCVILSGLTEEKKRAYRILDNKLTEDSSWAMDNLSLEVGWLEDQGYDVAEWGLDELVEGWNEDEQEAEDDGYAGEVPDETFLKLGDLLELGGHRVLCGDSTSAEQVAGLMQEKQASLLLTDPPYNVAYEGKTKEALTINNDCMGDKDFREFLFKCFSLCFSNMKEGASFYIWHADSEGYNFRGAVFDCNEEVRQCLIWVKQTMVMGRQDYQWKHEPCLYGWKKGAAHLWLSDRKQTTVLEFDRPTRSLEHPTMKPIELFSYQMGNSLKKGEIVLDPFLGSGTTLIAAEQLNRVCYGMEISPKYCQVILDRYIAHCLKSNKKADVRINGEVYNPVP